MLPIIRIAFWIFILIQIWLLIFSHKINRQVKAKYLDVLLVIKICIIAAYFIYTCPEISFFSDCFFHLFGCFLLIGLMLLVWRSYLPKSLDTQKTYTLTDLVVYKKADNYHVWGTIKADKYTFSACLVLSEEDYVRLHAQGFFDEHSPHGIQVKICSSPNREDEPVDLYVVLV